MHMFPSSMSAAPRPAVPSHSRSATTRLRSPRPAPEALHPTLWLGHQLGRLREQGLSSGYAALDEATCRNYAKHARFVPALGADGMPVESSYVDRVRWQLPAQ